MLDPTQTWKIQRRAVCGNVPLLDYVGKSLFKVNIMFSHQSHRKAANRYSVEPKQG